ncbi:PREDICTED: Alstrom syndrome protein 1 [Pseudopodoces humilis]|uniref:Alstrom syndrome protein 1 n=1 Tax=Pseudopodoces humilis TaxID=181119 RepID=UPI0006B7144A|nr:PREDICTED: Alstrom syndrome protein 1 [Pseudopodoces humilis]
MRARGERESECESLATARPRQRAGRERGDTGHGTRGHTDTAAPSRPTAMEHSRQEEEEAEERTVGSWLCLVESGCTDQAEFPTLEEGLLSSAQASPGAPAPASPLAGKDGHPSGHSGHPSGHSGHSSGHSGHSSGHSGHPSGHSGHPSGHSGHSGHPSGHSGHSSGHSGHSSGHSGHSSGRSSQGSNGPAAASELSERDKESPRQEEESSSSGNSSYKTALTKFSEKSERGAWQEKVKVLGSGVLEKQEKGKKVPELGLLNNFSDGWRKDRSGRWGAEGAPCAAAPEPGQGPGQEGGLQLPAGPRGWGLTAAPEELLPAILSQPAARLGTEEPAVPPSQPQDTAGSTSGCPGHCPGGAEPAAGSDELTGSELSIERGHKVTEISPSFSLGAEGSFSLHLARPNFQSTPGVFLEKTGKAEGRGVPAIPSHLRASLSRSDEETSGESPAPGPGKEDPAQSAVEESCGHLESLRLESPGCGRIQSCPALGFLEKVGAWHVSQPEQVPDSSGVPGALPPARKASSSLPRAASCILAGQRSPGDPKDCAAPSSSGAGSLGSWHFPHEGLLLGPARGRSRSDASLSSCRESRALVRASPACSESRTSSRTSVRTSPACSESRTSVRTSPACSESRTSVRTSPACSEEPPGHPSPTVGCSQSSSMGSLARRAGAGHGDARRSSAPDVFVCGVAQLLTKHKDCEEKENRSLKLNIPTGHDIMENFGAVSLENLDFPVGSGEPQGAPGCGLGSLVVPRPCPSAGENSSIPPGAALQTPEKEEFNIEERIPIYLRNLGIEQSPGSILAPFVPRRPLWELEFSPSELRSLQDPVGCLARVPPQAQGTLLPAFQMSEAGFGRAASPGSVSLPGGSEAVLSPRELSGEHPESQGSVPGPQPGLAVPTSPARGAEGSPGSAGAEQDVPSCSSGRDGAGDGGTSARVPFAGREPWSLQGWAAGALSGAGNGVELDRGSQSCSGGSESSQGWEGDSPMGSGALRELRELLARAEDLAAGWGRPAFPSAARTETGEAPPALPGREPDPGEPRLGKERIPEPRGAEPVTQRGVRGEGLGFHPPDPGSCHRGRGDPSAVSLQRREGLRGAAQRPRPGRAEPEGCSAVPRSQAVLVGLAQSGASSALSSAPQPGPPPLQPPGTGPALPGGSRGSVGRAGGAEGTRGSSSEDSSSGDSLGARVRSLLGSTGAQPGTFQDSSSGDSLGARVRSLLGSTRAQPGTFQGALQDSSSGDSLGARVRSLLGSTRAQPGTFQGALENSSSGDSLGARVRSLLGSTRAQPGTFQGALQDSSSGDLLGARVRSLLGSTRAQPGTFQGALQDSSGDSLAARVRSLLGPAAPGTAAHQILRDAEEQERKIRAWVKLKLASQSQESGPDRDEETQHRMEGMKAELFPKTRESAQAKDPWLCGLGAGSEYLRKQEQDQERFQAPRFPRDRHRQTDRQLFQSGSPPAVPVPRADPWDCSLLQDVQLNLWGPAGLQDMQLETRRTDGLQDMQLKPWNSSGLQDMQLKPRSTAGLQNMQDMQLKPRSTAELQDMQDMQLKPQSTAGLQDMQLKPRSTAGLQNMQDMQLKPRSTAELQDMQDMQLKPQSTAGLQDMQLKPRSTAGLQNMQDMQLKPRSTAELQDMQDMQLKPQSTAGLQDMQLEPQSTAELRVCEQHRAMEHCSAVAELCAPLAGDPCAGSGAAAPRARGQPGEPSSSVTLCSWRRAPAPLGSRARSPSLARDGILPGEAPCARPGEERLATEPWERIQSCPPSPTLARSREAGDAAELPPVPAASAGAPQGTAWGPGSIHTGQTQSLGAQQPQIPAAAVAGGHGQSTGAAGLRCGTAQEINAVLEPRSVSSPQQQEIPAGHTQLCDSSKGSGPAAQGGLEKGSGAAAQGGLEKGSGAAAQGGLEKSPSEVLAEGRKSPAEAALVPEQASSHPLPAEEALSSTSEAPSSAVRRFLSCVHITLSSRADRSELRGAGTAGAGMGLWDKPQVKAQAATLKAAPEASVESVPKFSPAEGIPEDPSPAVPVADPSQAFPPRQELLLLLRGSGARGAEGIPSSAPPAKPGRRTSDAATQITTESPTKTSFSAEICLDAWQGGNAAQHSSLPRAPEAPGVPASSHREIPPFPRQPAQPLLLPYKPLGSAGMYYVPCQRSGASVSPETSEASGNSSHSGSEDAAAVLLARVLALGDDSPPARAAAQHRGTSHGHRAKLAWAEEQGTPLEQSSELPDGSGRVKPSGCAPDPASGSCCPAPRHLCGVSAGAGHAVPSSGAVPAGSRRQGPRAPPGTGRQLSALPAEADDSGSEEPGAAFGNGMEPQPDAAGRDPAPPGPAAESRGKAARQRSRPRGSLGELWVTFLERQSRQQQDFGESGELSLVERLERLARLLQNPIRHALAPAAAGEKVPEGCPQGRERLKILLAGGGRSGSGTEPRGTRAGRRPRVIQEELGAHRPGQKVIQHLKRILEQQQQLGIASDSSSEARLSAEPGGCSSCSTSGWDTGTPAGLDTSPASGDSSSLSLATIDTARLLRAFGQHRLGLELPPRLAQLYCAISQQKSRSERWDEESEGAGAESLGKGQQSQSTIPFSSDSTCASSSSWGPSSALRNKRRTRMLNKGIQAGDLEIFSSGTRRNTRDVGVTFPTPRHSQEPVGHSQEPVGHSSQELRGHSQEPTGQSQQLTGHIQEPTGHGQELRGHSQEPTGHGQEPRGHSQQLTGPRHAVPGTWQRAPTDRLPTDRRTRSSRLHLQQGTQWLIPAEDLKCEWRKENQSSAIPGPGPAWFEPWSSTKPWREPLREKNWEQQPSLGRAGAGRGLGQPLGKLTLQEALALHRPDFISRSGQRLRHLRLLREERRLQRLLQSQREQLLQPPGKRQACRTANHRGFLMKEKRRAIPKREMFQRSKRLYEQLPEVRRKREEEQRKLEYSSHRLQARLYRTKITNRVLGKKVSWS